MSDKICKTEGCGTALNPKSDFDVCYFCHEGTTRPEYSSEAVEK